MRQPMQPSIRPALCERQNSSPGRRGLRVRLPRFARERRPLWPRRRGRAPTSPRTPRHVPAHKAPRPVGGRCAAHEEKPRAPRSSSLSVLIRCAAHAATKCGWPTRGAQHNQPTFLQWLEPAPHVSPQLCYTGKRRTAGAAIHSCFAFVGGCATFCLDDANYCVAGGACALARREDIQVVEEREQAVRRMKGGGGFEQGPMLPQGKEGRGTLLSYLSSSPWATAR